ncbi:uncharacterized protein UV8b_06873 [Ustilaginoidea virens]|uniref:Peptidase A1 domain-containing protein n=1 Tax=Ustilaginoidea virens TaxID=1159556 RepID=A0A063C917_USTVR|nr:uncharacterized protein UV8b_06873 [Ustilaginoidea virens]QUC22632.1 hypothetical protein UV8b_06873 [Ustilaginoidea virens]GAO16866.1 hypothetical protein UVI_02011870 [Ustilaginoidea virens]
MLSTALLSLAALPLAALAIELPLDNQLAQQPGLIRYPITVTPGAPHKNSFLRRQVDVAVRPEQSAFFYSIELQFGTPPQPVSVNFDTGSAELWINPVCKKSNDAAFCEKLGRFNGSQTYVDLKFANRINYGSGYAQLEYGYDYVQIGSARIAQQIFGVATDSEFTVTGVFGAGPEPKGWSNDYPMVLDNMVTQGLIKSRTFSLDIRSIGSARGSVVFGGLDTKKFSGRLEKRPIIPADKSPDGYTRYWVYLDGISLTPGDGSSVVVFDQVNGQPVLMDSGYTVSSLPTKYFDKIKDAFPGVTAPPKGDDSGMYRVPCNVGDENATVNFKFGKTEINVPYRDFIWKQEKDGSCVLGVVPDDKFPVLGDTFLRAAYVVYDQENRNIFVANNEDCGSSLLAIGTGADAVPSIEGDCSKADGTTSSAVSPSTSIKASISPSTTAPTGKNSTMTTTSKAAVLETTTTTLSTIASVEAGKNSTGVVKTDPTMTPGVTPAPFPTGSWYNATHLPHTYTSTFTTIELHNITSCALHSDGCSIGAVATRTIIGTTTWCPEKDGNPASKPTENTGPTVTAKPSLVSQPVITSVFITTKTHKIPSCPENGGSSCGEGGVSTEVLTLTTSVCPPSTGIFTIPRTHTCGNTETGCTPGDRVVNVYVVTVLPQTTADKPTPVPGCGDCILPPPARTLPPTTPISTTQPSMETPAPVPTGLAGTAGGITTFTKPAGTSPCRTCGSATNSLPPIATAGAAGAGRVSGMAGGMLLAVLAVAVL